MTESHRLNSIIDLNQSELSMENVGCACGLRPAFSILSIQHSCMRTSSLNYWCSEPKIYVRMYRTAALKLKASSMERTSVGWFSFCLTLSVHLYYYTDEGYDISVVLYRGCWIGLECKCAKNNVIGNEIAGFDGLNFVCLSYLEQTSQLKCAFWMFVGFERFVRILNNQWKW
jgi:hypothetical protein